VVNATLTCSDWDGATSNWWIDLYVDGEAPSATINATEEAGEGIPAYYHFLWMTDEFPVRAGAILTVIADTEDDSGAVVTVVWRSNKSVGWEQHDVGFADSFNQGNDVNWMHMSIEERHLQRELTVYSLEMELTDGAGNVNLTSWNVTVVDATAPTITAEVMVDGFPLGPLNPAMMESEIELNLTRSFDDIDAIENVVWAVFIDGQPIVENGTWDDVRIVAIPTLEVGTHELKIYAMDTSGNVREMISNPVVDPQVAAELSGVNITVEGEAIIGETGNIFVKIQNIGSTNARVQACYFDQCSREWDSGVATSEKPAMVLFPIEVTEFQSGKISVEVIWRDELTGEEGTFTMDSEIITQSKLSGGQSKIIILMVLGLIGYIIFRNRRDKPSTPF
jgi:hypothetical protein